MKVTFNISKENNFSEWFTEIIKKAELADLRYNVKGFIVFMPWSMICMKQMYAIYESVLEKNGHKPARFPLLIPESYFKLEAEHVEGFAPEVFWVTEHGAGEKFEERLAIRPTSETAMYKMYSYWIRSYRDLPLKLYQSVSVCRYETKATRPFLRSREFLWIEAHDAFATKEEALQQVKQDMKMAEEVLWHRFGIPFVFNKRPEWDKFAGAVATYTADTLMPNGKVIQQPSTHFLGQNFAKAFDIKCEDKDGKEKYVWQTCYGPAISRIFASVIAWHGDDNGLIFPFEIAPLQIVIIPIKHHENKEVLEYCKNIEENLKEKYRVEIDLSDKTPGEKFYFWEMKGVPLRFEIGPKEVANEEIVIFRRDTREKMKVKLKDVEKKIEELAEKILENLKSRAKKKFDESIVRVNSLEELKNALQNRKVCLCGFCSIGNEGVGCAEVIEKELKARVLGSPMNLAKKPTFEKCVVCGKQAKETVLIGFLY